jgi:integrase/recombinase XerD
VTLVEDFFVARKPLKGSPHTEAAYRADLAGVSAHIAACLGTEPGELVLGQVDAKVLRAAFASFSEGHAASSIARAWTAWDQFFAFLVAEDVVVGNPMAAVAKPKVPKRAPKALQGEGTPERLVESLAARDQKGRRSWPERDLAFVATALLSGLRLPLSCSAGPPPAPLRLRDLIAPTSPAVPDRPGPWRRPLSLRR